jgi:hypothetical protein
MCADFDKFQQSVVYTLNHAHLGSARESEVRLIACPVHLGPRVARGALVARLRDENREVREEYRAQPVRSLQLGVVSPHKETLCQDENEHSHQCEESNPLVGGGARSRCREFLT